MLRQLTGEGVDLSAFWTDAEMTALLRSGASEAADSPLEPPSGTSITRGDLFGLGTHPLLCGDSTSVEHVTRLLSGKTPTVMTADPPSGIHYAPAWRHAAYPSQRTAVGAVSNDDRPDWTEAWRLFPGSVAYVCHAALHSGTVAASTQEAGFVLRSQIIWVKQHVALKPCRLPPGARAGLVRGARRRHESVAGRLDTEDGVGVSDGAPGLRTRRTARDVRQ